MLGNIYEQSNQIDNALKMYDKAIQINPSNINSYLRLALLQREKGNFIAAQNTYADALSVWKDFPEAHLNLGILYDVYLNHPIRAQKHIEAYLFLTGNKNKEAIKWYEEIKSRTGLPDTYQEVPEQQVTSG